MYRQIFEIIPPRISNAIRKSDIDIGFVEEIRIRLNRQAYMIVSGKNILINVIANDDEMQWILKNISHNSLYAFRDTISNGFITVDGGIRVGIIGRASVDSGRIVGVYDISEFAFRFPNNIRINCSDIIPLIQLGSVLFYSPPGVGKTTLLRSITKELSKGRNAQRIGVIDTRGELASTLGEKELLVSILSGYPRKIGIEIAIRTMNSQIIVCDEIGDESDASAIIDAQGAGVPIIATCHGSDICDIFSHTGIRNLHRKRIFKYYVGIERTKDLGFYYDVHSWREANDFI